MWLYWTMYLLPAGAALFAGRSGRGAAMRETAPSFAWGSVWLALTIVIGYRYRVGADWMNYLAQLESIGGLAIGDILTKSDPGYGALNWLSTEMGWDIYGVNLICGGAFAFGLIAFCRTQPRPWLALSVAIPYLAIVVAMGYSRQGVALGLEMLGLIALSRGSTIEFVAWLALAATFHKSAIVVLPIAALAGARNRYWTIAWIAVVSMALYLQFLAKDVDYFYKNYIEAQYQSEGAMIRLLMNALPAALFLIWRKRFDFGHAQARLWTYFALLSLVMPLVVLASPSSTAVDRIALYLLPLQLVVFARWPDVVVNRGARGIRKEPICHSPERRGSAGKEATLVLVSSVLLYYGIVEFVWLNYAKLSITWLPYRFYPLEDSF